MRRFTVFINGNSKVADLQESLVTDSNHIFF